MSFRRFVHLVTDDACMVSGTLSLRNIDMSLLFRRPLDSTGARPPPGEMEPCPLPAPAMSFRPPPDMGHRGQMEFMFLGGNHKKVVAADHTGRAVLYDPDRHAVQTLRRFNKPMGMGMPFSLTTGGDHLYILDTIPRPGNESQCFECLKYNRDEEDWYPRVLPPPPPYDSDLKEEAGNFESFAASGDGSRIWISNERSGTYSFDTAAEVWSKAGDWALPFCGVAEYVPELGLSFGLRDNGYELCAVDLSAPGPPVVRNLWKDLTPPAEWNDPPEPYLVHLGAARFCIARFFSDHPLRDNPFSYRRWPVTHAVFTAVEVERCANVEGGLRMVNHGSMLFVLLDNIPYWVL